MRLHAVLPAMIMAAAAFLTGAAAFPSDLSAPHDGAAVVGTSFIDSSWAEFSRNYQYPATLNDLKPHMRCREVEEVLGRHPDRINYSYTTGGVFQEWEYPDGVTLYFTYSRLDSWHTRVQENSHDPGRILQRILIGAALLLIS